MTNHHYQSSIINHQSSSLSIINHHHHLHPHHHYNIIMVINHTFTFSNNCIFKESKTILHAQYLRYSHEHFPLPCLPVLPFNFVNLFEYSQLRFHIRHDFECWVILRRRVRCIHATSKVIQRLIWLLCVVLLLNNTSLWLRGISSCGFNILHATAKFNGIRTLWASTLCRLRTDNLSMIFRNLSSVACDTIDSTSLFGSLKLFFLTGNIKRKRCFALNGFE